MANCCSERCGWCGRCTDAHEPRPQIQAALDALEGLIRKADALIVEAEDTKQVALTLQFELLRLDMEDPS